MTEPTEVQRLGSYVFYVFQTKESYMKEEELIFKFHFASNVHVTCKPYYLNWTRVKKTNTDETNSL